MSSAACASPPPTCNSHLLQDILAMKYQIILVSPEMLQSRTFVDRILRNTGFMRNNIAMFACSYPLARR